MSISVASRSPLDSLLPFYNAVEGASARSSWAANIRRCAISEETWTLSDFRETGVHNCGLAINYRNQFHQKFWDD